MVIEDRRGGNGEGKLPNFHLWLMLTACWLKSAGKANKIPNSSAWRAQACKHTPMSEDFFGGCLLIWPKLAGYLGSVPGTLLSAAGRFGWVVVTFSYRISGPDLLS